MYHWLSDKMRLDVVAVGGDSYEFNQGSTWITWWATASQFIPIENELNAERWKQPKNTAHAEY
jgi:hypothetical protein